MVPLRQAPNAEMQLVRSVLPVSKPWAVPCHILAVLGVSQTRLQCQGVVGYPDFGVGLQGWTVQFSPRAASASPAFHVVL